MMEICCTREEVINIPPRKHTTLGGTLSFQRSFHTGSSFAKEIFSARENLEE
jgi:hypothetical protein